MSQADHQADEGNPGGLGDREIEHRLVDQEQIRAEIIDQHQKREARQPGRIGFPFEPGQAVRHLRRRDHVLHHVIEAAAVNLPLVTLDAGRQPGARLEAEVKVDEVKRAADPRDAGNNMQPAQDGAYGLSEYSSTVSGSPLLRPRQSHNDRTGII